MNSPDSGLEADGGTVLAEASGAATSQASSRTQPHVTTIVRQVPTPHSHKGIITTTVTGQLKMDAVEGVENMGHVDKRFSEQWDIKDTQTTYTIKTHVPGDRVLINDTTPDDLKVIVLELTHIRTHSITELAFGR
jgi:hypothetical protein